MSTLQDFTEYRIFLEEIASNEEDEGYYIKLGSYYLEDFEILGEVINWTLQFLTEKKCPASLRAPITRCVVESIQSECRKSPNICGFNESQGYDAKKLKHTLLIVLKNLCQRLLDNVELNKIMPSNSADSEFPICVSSSIRNRRRYMEDRHICIDDFNTTYNIKNAPKASFYAVFDGHCGDNAAYYSVSQLPYLLASDPSYPTDPGAALHRAFLATDDAFIKKCAQQPITGGTTAVCALHLPDISRLFIAWVGDSQALLVKKAEVFQIVKPHKPDCPEEKQRIINQGGALINWSGSLRVNGLLDLSRAIGDSSCKPYVSSNPDIVCLDLDKEEDFLVLGCDGLWDHVSDEEVAHTVYRQLEADKENLNEIPQRLIELSKCKGSTDNITVIVIFLKHPSAILKNSFTVGSMDPAFDNYHHSEDFNNPSHELLANANTDIDFKIEKSKDILHHNTPSINDDLNNLVQLEDSKNPFKKFDHISEKMDDFAKSPHDNFECDLKTSEKRPFEGDIGPETSVDALDDVVMAMAASEKEMFQESDRHTFSKTPDSVENFNPFENKNILFDFDSNQTKPKDITTVISDSIENLQITDPIVSPQSEHPDAEICESLNTNGHIHEEEDHLNLPPTKSPNFNNDDFLFTHDANSFLNTTTALPTDNTQLVLDETTNEIELQHMEEHNLDLPPCIEESNVKKSMENLEQEVTPLVDNTENTTPIDTTLHDVAKSEMEQHHVDDHEMEHHVKEISEDLPHDNIEEEHVQSSPEEFVQKAIATDNLLETVVEESSKETVNEQMTEQEIEEISRPEKGIEESLKPEKGIDLVENIEEILQFELKTEVDQSPPVVVQSEQEPDLFDCSMENAVPEEPVCEPESVCVKEETKPPVVAGPPESCDESEDEWNYMQLKEGDGEKKLIKDEEPAGSPAPEAEPVPDVIEEKEVKISESIAKEVESQQPSITAEENIEFIPINSDDKTELEPSLQFEEDNFDKDEDMSWQLNPEAKEFVPTSASPIHFDPISNGTPPIAAARQIVCDDVVAQSPRKGAISMEDIQIPSQIEFVQDILHCPSELQESPEPNDLYQEMNLKEAMHAAEKEEQASSDDIDYIHTDLDNADMKKSIYIEKSFEGSQDILNTVQPLPVEEDMRELSNVNVNDNDNLQGYDYKDVSANDLINKQFRGETTPTPVEEAFESAKMSDAAEETMPLNDITAENSLIENQIIEEKTSFSAKEAISQTDDSIETIDLCSPTANVLDLNQTNEDKEIELVDHDSNMLEEITKTESLETEKPLDQDVETNLSTPLIEEAIKEVSALSLETSKEVEEKNLKNKSEPLKKTKDNKDAVKKPDIKGKTTLAPAKKPVVDLMKPKVMSSTLSKSKIGTATTNTTNTMSRPRSVPAASKTTVEKKSITALSARPKTETKTTSSLIKKTQPLKPKTAEETKPAAVKPPTLSKTGITAKPAVSSRTSSATNTTSKPKTTLPATTAPTKPTSQRLALSASGKTQPTTKAPSPRSNLTSTLRKTEGVKSTVTTTATRVLATKTTTLASARTTKSQTSTTASKTTSTTTLTTAGKKSYLTSPRTAAVPKKSPLKKTSASPVTSAEKIKDSSAGGDAKTKANEGIKLNGVPSPAVEVNQ